MYAIWCYDVGDWLREPPSKVDDGGRAILVWTNKGEAGQRAAQHYGAICYSEAKRDGWCEVVEIGRHLPAGPRPSQSGEETRGLSADRNVAWNQT